MTFFFFFLFFLLFFGGGGGSSLSPPRLNIFTVGNMGVMICLGQGGLRSLSASSFNHIFPLDNGEGNHLLFFGDFLLNVGHLGKVLRRVLSLKIWDCYQLDIKSRDFKLSDDVWLVYSLPMIPFGIFLESISWTNRDGVGIISMTGMAWEWFWSNSESFNYHKSHIPIISFWRIEGTNNK